MLRELTKQGRGDGTTRRPHAPEAIDRCEQAAQESPQRKFTSHDLPAWPSPEKPRASGEVRGVRSNSRAAVVPAPPADTGSREAPAPRSGDGADSTLELLRKWLQSRPHPDAPCDGTERGAR